MHVYLNCILQGDIAALSSWCTGCCCYIHCLAWRHDTLQIEILAAVRGDPLVGMQHTCMHTATSLAKGVHTCWLVHHNARAGHRISLALCASSLPTRQIQRQHWVSRSR